STGVGRVLNTTGFTMILAFMEQTPLSNAYNFSQTSVNAVYQSNANVKHKTLVGDDKSNTTVVGSLVATFACPSDTQPEIVNSTSARASAHFYDDMVNFAALRPPGRLGIPVLVS
ncbi:MAG TPA: DUF1559 domain-containing protein, partial [Rariglobus sp.]